MKNIITGLFLVTIFFSTQAQKLVAHYPMDNTTEDIVGYHPHLIMPNCHYQGAGIFTQGYYGNAETRNYVHATGVSQLDYQHFAVSLDIKSSEVKRMNIFTINRSSRVLGCYINNEGLFELKINNGDIKVPTTVKYEPNRWYNVAISYNNTTKKTSLYINKTLVVTKVAQVDASAINSAYASKDISTIDYSNAQAFIGVCKNLKVINGPYDPATVDNLNGEGITNSSSSNTASNGKGTIPRFTRGQGMQELDAAGYRELSKHGVVFINFAQPSCDLATYYIETIEEINKSLPDIPIYSFNKELYPEIEKEFQLYGAQFLAKIQNGKFVSHYEGYRGDNLIREWVIKEWNKDKGTNIPVEKYRSAPTNTSGVAVDFTTLQNFRFPFTSAVDPGLAENKQFVINSDNAKLIGGTLLANGEYRTTKHTRTPNLSPILASDFSLYMEFMPTLTQYNTLIMTSGREMGIVIQKGKLTLLFNNGDFGYVIDEVDVEALKWYKLALSYHHNTRTAQLILNDKRLDDVVVSTKVEASKYSTAWGITDFGNGEVYSGFLDNLNFYGKALSGNNLKEVYDRNNRGTTDVRKYMPKNVIGEFKFSDKNNSVSNAEELNVISDASFLTNGHLKLSDQIKNRPIIETSDLSGLNPENTTIMLDLYAEQASSEYAKELFSIQNTYGKEYASVKIEKGEVTVSLSYYMSDWNDKSVNFKTQNLNLEDGIWYNLIVSLNEKTRTIIVAVDGKEVLNKTYKTDLKPKKSTDKSRVVFQKYAYGPTTFNGYVDNLVITRSASISSGIQQLFASKQGHGGIGKVVKPTPVTNEVHTSNLAVKLHEWGYDDYKNHDYNSFSKLGVINTPINFKDFDQALLNACIFYQTNNQRRKHSRSEFSHIPSLEKAATMHSTDMADLEFFSHDNPYDAAKANHSKRIQLFGLNASASAENIASRYERNISYWYLAELIVQQWMDSPGHKRNILDERLESLGCGVMFSQSYGDELGGNFLATQNFAKR